MTIIRLDVDWTMSFLFWYKDYRADYVITRTVWNNSGEISNLIFLELSYKR